MTRLNERPPTLLPPLLSWLCMSTRPIRDVCTRTDSPIHPRGKRVDKSTRQLGLPYRRFLSTEPRCIRCPHPSPPQWQHLYRKQPKIEVRGTVVGLFVRIKHKVGKTGKPESQGVYTVQRKEVIRKLSKKGDGRQKDRKKKRTERDGS